MEADGGNAFPSEDLLALETALTTRAVSTHLRLAVDQGWLRRYRERRRGKAWAQYFYQAAIPAHLDAPERRSPPQAGGTERGAHGPERNNAVVPNHVPLNTTGISTKSITAELSTSPYSRAQRHEDCAAFLTELKRRGSILKAPAIQDPGDGSTAPTNDHSEHASDHPAAARHAARDAP